MTYNPKKFGKIITIEGLWRIGKTTMCLSLSKKFKRVKFIPEPDHLQNSKRPSDIEFWYLRQCQNKMEEAKKLKQKGYTVIMERSFISTIAFNVALGRKLTKKMHGLVKYHKNNLPDVIFVLDIPIHFLKKIVAENKDRKIRKTKVIIQDKKFIERYNRAFKKEATKLPMLIYFIKAGDQNNLYPTSLTLSKIVKKLPLASE